ncbi:glycoside hydrolase superfamily [Amylostereum chailletii]|nr:glycoside hydrolase superfamily [Amylostereum chailletii]
MLGSLALSLAMGAVSFRGSLAPVNALDNGVAKLPVMGYNTWNAYHCDINETVILQTANLLKTLGLADLGYNYMNIDDCWHERNRSADGFLVPSTWWRRVPSIRKKMTRL